MLFRPVGAVTTAYIVSRANSADILEGPSTEVQRCARTLSRLTHNDSATATPARVPSLVKIQLGIFPCVTSASACSTMPSERLTVSTVSVSEYSQRPG